ncbi:hypothetical protein G6F40_013180 [Rhizopus arrhizus]|nr:hypothetical protein G6F40_013180 [Rhizopus arrhizus]
MAHNIACLVAADRTGAIAGQFDPVGDLLAIEKLRQEVGDIGLSEHALHRRPIEKFLLHVEDELQAFELGAELVRGSREEARKPVLHERQNADIEGLVELLIAIRGGELVEEFEQDFVVDLECTELNANIFLIEADKWHLRPGCNDNDP